MATDHTARASLGGRRFLLAAPDPYQLARLAKVLDIEAGMAPGLAARMARLDAAERLARVDRALDLARGDRKPDPGHPESGQLLALGRVLRGLIGAALAAGEPEMGGGQVRKALDRITPLEALDAYASMLRLLEAWAKTASEAMSGADRLNKLVLAAAHDYEGGT